jgi:uncharacterized protein YutE (UPF0331/DUF86 family)
LTDPDLVAKRLAYIETCVYELRRLARPDQFHQDVLQERFAEHTLQIAIQAVLDVASHIVSDERLGEPRTRAALFDLLHRGGWIDGRLAEALQPMAGFRNVLVHAYADVNLEIVRQIVEHRLDDLLAFVSAIRARMRPAADGSGDRQA